MTAPKLPHDIVHRAQAADPQALSTIYEHYAPAIYRYIYYRVGDADLARDIQSEVFVRMLEGIGRYEDRGWSIGTWLYSIAHARTVDGLRRRERQSYAPLNEEDLIATCIDEQLDQSLRGAAIKRALARMGEGQRRVLLLRHVYGLSLEETACQMGRTVGSIKSLQHRAHERFRQFFDEEMHNTA